MKKPIEEYLRENIEKGNTYFGIRASASVDGTIEFYIHPIGVNGETLDYTVEGNQINPKQTSEVWYG